VVVTLCAAWCNTCTEFRAAFAAIAAERPEVAFVWLDIEDDAAICGDVEVESFPTLFAFRGDAIVHFGTSVPLRNVVARVVDDLATRRATIVGVPSPLLDLRRALLRLPEAA
jgi:thioredoxin reductase (NADPH)